MKITIDGTPAEISEYVSKVLDRPLVDKTIVPPVEPNRMRGPLKLYEDEPPFDAKIENNAHDITGISFDGKNWKVNCKPEQRGAFTFDGWTIPCKDSGGHDKAVASTIAEYYQDVIDWDNSIDNDIRFTKPIKTKVRMSSYNRSHGKNDWVERRWEEIQRIDLPKPQK